MQGVGNYYQVVGLGANDGNSNDTLSALLIPAIAIGSIWLLFHLISDGEFYDWNDAPQYAKDAAWARARSDG